MADLTSTQLQALITATYDALLAAMASPKPSYTIGGKSVDHNGYVRELRETLKMTQAQLAVMPSEYVRNLDDGINDQGEDKTQYEGDQNL